LYRELKAAASIGCAMARCISNKYHKKINFLFLDIALKCLKKRKDIVTHLGAKRRDVLY
jgi:hypothetical protein